MNRVILEGFLSGHSTRRTTRIFKRVFKGLISAQKAFNLVNPSNRFATLPGRAGKDAGEIYEADTLTELQAGLKVFCLKWRAKEPKAVKNFLSGFELTLTYLAFCGEPWRTLIRTTNPKEALFRKTPEKNKTDEKIC